MIVKIGVISMDNIFQNLGNLNLNNLLEGVQHMQTEMQKVKKELEEKTVEGVSGGDMVKAVVNGAQEIINITIAKEVVDPDDIEMLQDLVVAAVNDGMRKANEMIQQEMSQFTGGMNIPGLNLNNLF